VQRKRKLCTTLGKQATDNMLSSLSGKTALETDNAFIEEVTSNCQKQTKQDHKIENNSENKI